MMIGSTFVDSVWHALYNSHDKDEIDISQIIALTQDKSYLVLYNRITQTATEQRVAHAHLRRGVYKVISDTLLTTPK
jgi:hypothetical protein